MIKRRARGVPAELFVVMDVKQKELKAVDCIAEHASLVALEGDDVRSDSASV